MEEDDKLLHEVLLRLSQEIPVPPPPQKSQLRRSQRNIERQGRPDKDVGGQFLEERKDSRVDSHGEDHALAALSALGEAPVSMPLDSSLGFLNYSDPFGHPLAASGGINLAGSNGLFSSGSIRRSSSIPPFSFASVPTEGAPALKPASPVPAKPSSTLRSSKGSGRVGLARSPELRVSETLGKASAPPSPVASPVDEPPPEPFGAQNNAQGSSGLRQSGRHRGASLGVAQALAAEKDLTYEEKKTLAAAVVALDSEGLQSIMELIRTHEPALLEKGDEGFQFDLMDLQPATVLAIKSFVDTSAMPGTALRQRRPLGLEEDDPEYEERPRRADLKVSGTKRAPQLLMKVPDTRPQDFELTCDVCGKVFADRSNLSKHQRSHSNDRPFKCLVCHKTFRHSSTLKDHENIHKETKPYQCRVCQKQFANSANVKRHERTHTDSKPFACMHCGRPFNQSSNCKQHEKKCGGTTSAIKRRSLPPEGPAAKRPRLE